MDSFLPAKFSLSPFFVRHVAHPKRMKYIEGLNRAQICAVNDDGYIPNKGYANAFPPNNFNENIIKANSSVLTDNLPKQTFRRKEKAMPPQGRFQTYGLVDDVDNWRSELNKLAVSVGLITETDIEAKKKQKDRAEFLKSLDKQNKPPSSKPSSKSQSDLSSKKPLSSYSSKTSRLNEPLLTGRRTSRSRGSLASRSFSVNKQTYLVDDTDREAWMLKVLCQILQTDNLVDVHSWLVSSHSQEKDQVKKLIDQAMTGLEASGRIENNNGESAHTSNVKQRDAETQVNHNNLDSIQNAIDKMKIQSPAFREDANKFSRHLSAASNSNKNSNTTNNFGTNILKLPDISEEVVEIERKVIKSQVENKHSEDYPKILPKLPERDVQVMKFDDQTEYKAPISPVFNINIFPSQNKNNTKHQGKENKNDNTVIQVEGPSSKDFKIEELNVTMLVKDEKSNLTQRIGGNWKPDSSLSKPKNDTESNNIPAASLGKNYEHKNE